MNVEKARRLSRCLSYKNLGFPSWLPGVSVQTLGYFKRCVNIGQCVHFKSLKRRMQLSYSKSQLKTAQVSAPFRAQKAQQITFKTVFELLKVFVFLKIAKSKGLKFENKSQILTRDILLPSSIVIWSLINFTPWRYVTTSKGEQIQQKIWNVRLKKKETKTDRRNRS